MADRLTRAFSSAQRTLLASRTSTTLPSYFCGFQNVYNIHINVKNQYPRAALLPLPDNFQDINASETGQFSPLRNRDISSVFISSTQNENTYDKIDITVNNDPHIGSYDCHGAVSLSSSMQSNVPSPFGGQGSILSMPGSQIGQSYKYLSDYLHTSHYLNLRNSYIRNGYKGDGQTGMIRSYHSTAFTNCFSIKNITLSGNIINRNMSDGNLGNTNDEKPLSRKQQLKQAVAAYGSTVIVFHVTISLASLGAFYLLVSSGLDVIAWMQYFGIGESALVNKITANAGTFVIAYAVHKVFAPVRIGITLTATPFIVRYLRNIGILKKPQK